MEGKACAVVANEAVNLSQGPATVRLVNFRFLSLIMQLPFVAGHDFTDVQIFSWSLHGPG